jgi:hypothetical protein
VSPAVLGVSEDQLYDSTPSTAVNAYRDARIVDRNPQSAAIIVFQRL